MQESATADKALLWANIHWKDRELENRARVATVVVE